MAKADISQLTGLMDLISGVTGKESSSTTKTSGGTKTQQVQLSDAAVQEQIKNILRGPGGVRDIGNSARKSGLYNATSEDLLLGNLYSSAAAQGEIARAPTVVTTDPVKSTVTNAQEGAGIGTVLGTLAGTAVLSKLLEVGSDGIGNAIGGFFGGGGTTGQASSGTTGSSGSPMDAIATSFGVGPDSSVGMTSSFTDGQVNPNSGPSFTGDTFGAQLGQGLAGVGDGNVGKQTSGTFGIGGSGSDEFDIVGSVGSALSGFFGGGGLGGLVGAITGGTGGTAGGSGGSGSSSTSIICTALMSRGLLSEVQYAAGQKYIQQISPITKIGYYVWAASVAEKIRKGDQLLTNLCLPFAAGRTALLASPGKLRDHLTNPCGTLTKFVGEPICWIIGAVVTVAAVHANKQELTGV